MTTHGIAYYLTPLWGDPLAYYMAFACVLLSPFLWGLLLSLFAQSTCATVSTSVSHTRCPHMALPFAYSWWDIIYLFPRAVEPSTSQAKEDFLRWLRRLLREMDMNSSELTGHSFRAGGATDLYQENIPHEIIKLMGRWRSDAYLIYCRENPAVSAHRVAIVFDRIMTRAERGG